MGMKKLLKKDTSHVLKRAQRFPVILIGEGLLTGVLAGLVVLFYRVALQFADKWLEEILAFIGRNPLRIAGWFFVLILLAVLVGKMVKWEPMISGSGIPQVEGEITGKLTQNWRRVLPAKFLGGFLCLLGGLSLGREGPSIQLGAMAGQGISQALDRNKTEERHLMTCGASAGLAAAFHAPLAGMMFALEEIHKGFSVSVLISVMTASVTADYIASYIIGLDPVFQFQLEKVLPGTEYEVAACCQTAEEALEQYDKVQPDLVTMDIILPGMDGLEAARAMLAAHPEARILMVSSLAYDDTVQEAESIGAKGFVFKPFDRDQLVQAVEKAFAEA